MQEYFDLFYEAHFKQDIKNIHRINSIKDELHFGALLTQIETAQGKKAVVLSKIRELFRLIQIGTSPILSELVEKEME